MWVWLSYGGRMLIISAIAVIILLQPSAIPSSVSNNIGSANIAKPSTREAFAQAPSPIVGQPISHAKLNIDLSGLTKAEPAGPGDPIGESETEPAVGPEGVTAHGNVGQDFLAWIVAPFAASSNSLAKFVSPKPQMASADGSFSAPILNFPGIPAAFVPELGFVPYPPDTVGDVGPNHYIQMVNSQFAIYDKTGNKVAGPSFMNSLWANASALGLLPPTDPCVLNNDGDPIVLYDSLADRWLMSQMVAFTNQCIAVSQGANPVSGGWFLYDYVVPAQNDYPKFGVWPDGYYMSTYEGTTLGAYAFDRANLLAGSPLPSFIYFNIPSLTPNFRTNTRLMPGDLDGANPPPAGSPNIFLRTVDGAMQGGGADRIEVWQFTANFASPLLSSFTGPTILVPAPFDIQMCGAAMPRSCIPQPGTAVGIDPQANRPMWRAQYRNFGSYETLLLSQNVDIGDFDDHAGTRWYELRRVGGVGGAWSMLQQGNYSPDANHHWMGSMAMDGSGNIAFGYSVSSNTVFPSIKYTGRLSTDPLGTMPQGEFNILTGAASQTLSNRWGDYSSMNVDPVDDCTFWYTTEYLNGTSQQWTTQIATLKFPDCGAKPVGGEIVDIDTTSMLLAGAFTNASLLMPIIGVVAAGMVVLALRRRAK